MAPAATSGAFASAQENGIYKFEEWWVQHQPFFLTRGYSLRSRYHPSWVPTWKLPENEGVLPNRFEDDLSMEPRGKVLDAVRIADGAKVVLKRVLLHKFKYELQTIRLLDDLRKTVPDSRNRTVPLLEVIPLPDDNESVIIVMPMYRIFDDPPFQQLSEVVEAFHQFLEGLEYMHSRGIAHRRLPLNFLSRDPCHRNLAMDATNVVPSGWHFRAPWSSDGGLDDIHSVPRASVAPVQYFFLDFGLSEFFPDGIETAKAYGKVGLNKNAPEMSNKHYNPFKMDVYQLGNVFMDLIQKYEGLEKFRSLAVDMAAPVAETRPTAAEALTTFEKVLSTLSPVQLNAAIALVCGSEGSDDSDG
ncbi:hypothetical protein C8R43DRAFT_1087297 [Mycena crocata]|nr:hypothetical protein C8R43DRAFT_1087297 [Mycena crocata]